MPKMTITSTAVVPPKTNAARKEAVEIHAQVDCRLWFNDGFTLGLKKNGSCYLAFDNDGWHHFEVKYTTPTAVVQESISAVQASSGGASVMTETAVMTTQAAAGPTGDIVVP